MPKDIKKILGPKDYEIVSSWIKAHAESGLFLDNSPDSIRIAKKLGFHKLAEDLKKDYN